MPAALIDLLTEEWPDIAMEFRVSLTLSQSFETDWRRPIANRSVGTQKASLLPALSSDLRQAIADWDRRYQGVTDSINPFWVTQCRDLPIEAWNEDGRRLAKAVCDELDERWVVGYRGIERKYPQYFLSAMGPINASRRKLPDRNRPWIWGDGTEAYAGELPDNWPEFPEWRWVRVGPLPYTSGLMRLDRLTMCIEDLPLSPDLAAHFEKRLDACVAEQEELEIEEIFEREGKDWIERLRVNAEVSKQIALDLREALPWYWKVVFFDYNLFERGGTSRADFEYRIEQH